MKRISIILLTVLYASLSLGVELNLHYCGGQLAAVAIALPSSNCCCDDSNTKNDCCNDTQMTVQMDMVQVFVAQEFQESIFIEASDLYFTQPVERATVLKSTLNHFPNPPPLSAQEFRIQLGALTFYG